MAPRRLTRTACARACARILALRMRHGPFRLPKAAQAKAPAESQRTQD